MKKLTRRQQEFFSRFLDLYHQAGHSLHYVAVARHLGVAKVTAYEMLRLLEKRGLVQAEYQLPAGPHGPGRSSVVFRPTSRAEEMLSRLAGQDWDASEWEAARTHILQQLREGKAGGYERLLDELLARIPQQRSPMVYIAEMITAILLGLESLKGTARARSLGKSLRAIGFPGELSLQALSGLSVGLSLVERVNRRLAGLLRAQAGRYHAALAELSEEHRRRLADFAHEVTRIVGV